MIPLSPPTDILLESSLVMAVSYLDYVFGNFLRYYHRRYPDAISSKESVLTLNEIKLCSDVSEVEDLLITKEVERILYNSFTDKINHFQ